MQRFLWVSWLQRDTRSLLTLFEVQRYIEDNNNNEEEVYSIWVLSRALSERYVAEGSKVPLPLMQRVDIIILLQKEINSIITGTIF